jgi:hypothetical protein
MMATNPGKRDMFGLASSDIVPSAVATSAAAQSHDAPCSLDRPVKLRVTCMSLRHKLMYVDDRHAQRGMVDGNSDTRVYWCSKTQSPLGPDDRPAAPDECSNGRECYCHGG